MSNSNSVKSGTEGNTNALNYVNLNGLLKLQMLDITVQ